MVASLDLRLDLGAFGIADAAQAPGRGEPLKAHAEVAAAAGLCQIVRRGLLIGLDSYSELQAAGGADDGGAVALVGGLARLRVGFLQGVGILRSRLRDVGEEVQGGGIAGVGGLLHPAQYGEFIPGGVQDDAQRGEQVQLVALGDGVELGDEACVLLGVGVGRGVDAAEVRGIMNGAEAVGLRGGDGSGRGNDGAPRRGRRKIDLRGRGGAVSRGQDGIRVRESRHQGRQGQKQLEVRGSHIVGTLAFYTERAELARIIRGTAPA